MKFMRPLYREFLPSPIPGSSELAVGTPAANCSGHHPICRKILAAEYELALNKTAPPP